MTSWLKVGLLQILCYSTLTVGHLLLHPHLVFGVSLWPIIEIFHRRRFLAYEENESFLICLGLYQLSLLSKAFFRRQ